MTIKQAIETLLILGNNHGMDTPVYVNGEPEIEQVESSGIRFREAETVENGDNPEEQLPLWPDRVVFKS